MEKISIEELEKFFASRKLPATIMLGPGEKIIDVNKFVEAQLDRVKAYPDLPLYKVFYENLVKLKSILEADGNNSKQ